MPRLPTVLLCCLLAACGHTPISGDVAPSAAPVAAGGEPARFESLARDLDAGVYPNAHALLVLRAGRIVHEQYLAGDDENWGQPVGYREFDAGSLHDLRSVSKSITALLLGIALGDEYAAALERPIIEYFPEFADRIAPGADGVTLRHVLTMTTGLEWNEMDVPYSNPQNDEIRMYYSGDPVEFVLTRPLSAVPGERWYYHGGTTLILAALVEQISGQPFLEFVRASLFEPLGIEMRYVDWRGLGIFWKRSATLPGAASGLRMRAPDLARIGQLVLDGGRWQGRQLVPRGWIDASLARQVEQDTRWNVDGVYGYGFQWWHANFHGRWGEFEAACGTGFGGQRLCVLSAERLVVVIFAGNYGNGIRLVPERLLAEVIAAVRSSQ